MANYTFPYVPQLYEGDTITFRYTGDVQSMDLEKLRIGVAKIECYGARGDSYGGYTYGTLDFKTLPDNLQYLYFVVGQSNPKTGNTYENCTFGGGGTCDGSWSGGGASDVRTVYDPKNTSSVADYRPFHIDKGTLNIDSLYSRFIVAGGAGGRDCHGRHQGPGRPGGGWFGATYGGHYASYGDGGQSYSSGGGDGPNGHGGFGYGGTAWEASGAGGGGWWGGTGSDGGGGGSSYAAGNPNCNGTQTTSGIVLTKSGTIAGGHNSGESHGKIVVTVIEPGFIKSTKGLLFSYAKSNTVYADSMYEFEMANQPKGCIVKSTPANYKPTGAKSTNDTFDFLISSTKIAATPVCCRIKEQGDGKTGHAKR